MFPIQTNRRNSTFFFCLLRSNIDIFSRRRSTIESTLHCSGHFLHDEHFHRYNLAKFPCSLKQLQDSFEKLIELCTTYFGS